MALFGIGIDKSGAELELPKWNWVELELTGNKYEKKRQRIDSNTPDHC